MDKERLANALERIAAALEASNEQHEEDHSGPLMEAALEGQKAALEGQRRQLELSERQVSAYEEHVRAHRDAGLPPVEPGKDIPIQ